MSIELLLLLIAVAALFYQIGKDIGRNHKKK